MYSLFVCAFLTLSGAYAADTVIITTLNPGTPAAQKIVGFSDSSFDYSRDFKPENKSLCYVGSAEAVCDIVNKEASEMEQRYLDGAHNNMTVSSCTVEGKTVKADYTLYDDYSTTLFVSRSIEACK